MRSPEQTPLAKKIARWQGEPVAVVIANSRAHAEDALELIEVDWVEKEAQVDMETALDSTAVLIHPELGNNLFWTRTVNQGDVEKAFKDDITLRQSAVELGYLSEDEFDLIIDPKKIDSKKNTNQGEQ